MAHTKESALGVTYFPLVWEQTRQLLKIASEQKNTAVLLQCFPGTEGRFPNTSAYWGHGDIGPAMARCFINKESERLVSFQSRCNIPNFLVGSNFKDDFAQGKEISEVHEAAQPRDVKGLFLTREPLKQICLINKWRSY